MDDVEIPVKVIPTFTLYILCVATDTTCMLHVYVGLMELKLSQLSQPPSESLLLRHADPTFISRLKDRMVKDPAAPGAAPMAVLCKSVNAL